MMREWFNQNRARDDEEIIVEYMTRLSQTAPARRSQIPDPAVLWMKAEMLKRWDAERRATAPLDAMEPIQIAAGLAAAAVLFVWSFPALLQVLFTSI
jgi:hypothetical protein